jgi:hypothetical protein
VAPLVVERGLEIEIGEALAVQGDARRERTSVVMEPTLATETTPISACAVSYWTTQVPDPTFMTIRDIVASFAEQRGRGARATPR